MDHQLWQQLSHAMFDVARTFCSNPRHSYDTHRIVRVYLWAVLHDRSVHWATKPQNWTSQTRPHSLPNQSTMSRRLRQQQTTRFLEKLARRLSDALPTSWIKSIDGKPLTVPKHSGDPDATYGRGVGGFAKGYKLHAIWGNSTMPLAWSVQPLHVAEIAEAKRLIPQLKEEGYLLADANYDSRALYEQAASHGHQLIAPRRRPYTSRGHRPPTISRERAIHLLEESPSRFGRELFSCRRNIERQFSGFVAFGGGLQCLPSWVRTLHRVRLFVHAKLIINATRLRVIAA